MAGLAGESARQLTHSLLQPRFTVGVFLCPAMCRKVPASGTFVDNKASFPLESSHVLVTCIGIFYSQLIGKEMAPRQPQVPAVKPGIKTSEFYAMLAGIVVSLLLQGNVIGESEVATWQTLLAELLPAIGGIVMYIWSRTKVKVA